MPERERTAPQGGNASPPTQNVATQAPAKNSSTRKIVLFTALAAGVGGGGMWLARGRGSEPAQAAGPTKEATETVVHLDGFTVNLADSEDNHFLRVTMDLSLEHLPTPQEHDKPNSGLPMPRIRDTILSVLTVCKAEPLLTPEGKQQLKKNLLGALNRSNPELGVREIYFTEFLVQR